jgi:predicted secreted protein
MTLPLPVATAIAVYITIWWITLFVVLPLGIRSQHESDDPAIAGTDPGAPVAPGLLWKAGITTLVSAILFAALMVVLRLTE